MIASESYPEVAMLDSTHPYIQRNAFKESSFMWTDDEIYCEALQ